MSEGCALELDALSLVGGYAFAADDGEIGFAEGGGAVVITGSPASAFFESSPTTTLNVVDCSFSGNIADESNGGAATKRGRSP